MDERTQDFRDYWFGLTPPRKQAFAAACITTVNYLTQVAYGHRQAGPAFARAIYEKSERVVRLSSLRADIWPEEAAHEKSRSPRRESYG